MCERAPSGGTKQQNEVCSIVQPPRERSRREQAWRSVGLPGCGVARPAVACRPSPHHGLGLVDVARLAEEVGLDGVVIGDHVVLGNRLDRYPYPPVHFAHDASWMEPLSVLAAISAVTTRIKLTTGVLVSPLRPAVLLAKTAATVDHLSDGRLELGVGVGWQPESSPPSASTSRDGASCSRRDRRLSCAVGNAGVVRVADGEASTTSGAIRSRRVWTASGALFRLARPRNVTQDRGARRRLDHAPPPAARGNRGRSWRRWAELRGLRARPGHADRAHVAADRAREPGGEPDFDGSFASIGDHRDAGITDLTVWSNSFVDTQGTPR